MKSQRKAFVLNQNCVACGTCIHVCPLSAIKITNGIYAEINEEKCVGCGKCKIACPASVIEIKLIEQNKSELEAS